MGTAAFVLRSGSLCNLRMVRSLVDVILGHLNMVKSARERMTLQISWFMRRCRVQLPLVTQQEAERSKFVVMKAEQERRAAIIRAEGESESAMLISDATRAAGNGIIELRRIEASREIAGTLARTGNVVYLPKQNNMLLGLNPAR